MASKLLVDEEPQNILPLRICPNLREKIEPEQIPTNEIILLTKEKRNPDEPLVYFPLPKRPLKPKPRHSLSMLWSPDKLCIVVDDSSVTTKFCVWNMSAYSIYVHLCGLWDETVRFGANWRCYPRTRFLLAPGLAAEMYINVTPKKFCRVPLAYAALQLAAAHMRDTVTGYFVVPIKVIFKNYIPPNLGEGG